VEKVEPLSDGVALLDLSALDNSRPSSLTVVTPPDIPTPLPPERLSFDLRGLDSLASFSLGHRLLAAVAPRVDEAFTAALGGRVTLESWQFAPALRMLAKPRPRLLIADDVGLGKTIEAGLAILELMARGRAERILLVVPPGLVLQWQQELADKFSMHFDIIENASGLSRIQQNLPAGISPWDVLPFVLTSIDYLKKETVCGRALRSEWDLVIVDEAHSLAMAGSTNNPYTTQRTRLGRALSENSRGLLLLTATPHNGYGHSFHSLLEFVEPGISLEEGPGRDRRIASAMIRRLKPKIRRVQDDGSEKAVFPDRNVEPLPVKVVGKERELLNRVASYCAKTAKLAEGADDRDLVSFAMQIIKKRASSSRYALGKTIEQRLSALKGKEDVEKPSPYELRDLQADLPVGDATQARMERKVVQSALPKDEKRRKEEITKLNSLKKLLGELPKKDPKIECLLGALRELLKDPDEKAIVFTEYRDTLDAVWTALQGDKQLADTVVVLRGGMSGHQRAKVQEEFEKQEIRILLATDAASEGLNLQRHCRAVFHIELPWNPNRMEQRNGRVDRYGQERNPQIRYLYYPDSAEDDVLSRLALKIEQMRKDQVAVPDMLGVHQGDGTLLDGLTYLDGEDPEVKSAAEGLIQGFDKRLAEFEENVKPLLLAEAGWEKEGEIIRQNLDRAAKVLGDDAALEGQMKLLLGPSLRPLDTDGIYSLETPRRFQGPGVAAHYARLTFRRSLAVKAPPHDLEFVGTRHPLVLAAAQEARKRFVQVYEGERGIWPRRLAARRVSADKAPAIVFTFLLEVKTGDGQIHQEIAAVSTGLDGKVLDGANSLEKWMESPAGEVSSAVLERMFAPCFEANLNSAKAQAEKLLRDLAASLGRKRMERADVLAVDIEADLQGRLVELKRQQERAEGRTEASGQARLFAEDGYRPGDWERRCEMAKRQAEERRKGLETYRRVEPSGEPRSLGALFLVPEGVK
jgi:superfamily II DNA or RNA helicase